MNLLETNTHSFIVKIWQEETAAEARHGKWRGRITHVGSSEYGDFEDLTDISRFIAPLSGAVAQAGAAGKPGKVFTMLVLLAPTDRLRHLTAAV